MEIRTLSQDELVELLELYRHLHDRDDRLPDENTIHAVWEHIQKDLNHLIFGLFENGMLISSCVLNIIPNLTRGFRPYSLIENVVTHSGFRKQGFGTALLKHTLEYAWQRNCYKVMLLTGRRDEAVYRFYESAGFDRNAKQAFLSLNPAVH